MGKVSEERLNIQKSFFPKEIPKLWCPLLTHYNDNREIDRERMKKHINFLSPYISSFLVPGSTGDGWEMQESEREELLDFLLQEARSQDFWIMIGVLKTERGAALNSIINNVKRYLGKETANIDDFVENRICGFTVTPPKGQDLSQETIYKELENILATSYPVSLYQLPQITENEMTPKTVMKLASQYPNFYLLKDTSGE
ncbi:MAG: dihydrodipicolinate synthase family protein, partial [archaeon]